MCARGELFCGEGRRASRVGHRRHVDESRAAGKRRGRHFAGRRRRRTSTGIVCREKREREREREGEKRKGGGRCRPGEKQRKIEWRTFACFRVSLYISLPTYTCRRVSRRCSGLNIPAARLPSLSLRSVSRLSRVSLAPRCFRSAYHRRDGPQTNA